MLNIHALSDNKIPDTTKIGFKLDPTIGSINTDAKRT